MVNRVGRLRRNVGAERHTPESTSCPLSYCLGGHSHVRRCVVDSRGNEYSTELELGSCSDIADLAAAFDAAWLRLPASPWPREGRPRLRIADIFSGCGGMTLGACEAAWAIGLSHEIALAVDTNKNALQIYTANFAPKLARAEPVEGVFDGELGGRLTRSERRLRLEVGQVDILLAGPPCQGNSDLNNHTRRADPKNGLYVKMARCAEVIRPLHIVIENVPGVRHDKGNAVALTEEFLHKLGYSVATGILDADDFGVPQVRRRHFMVASRHAVADLASMTQAYFCPSRSLEWAIADLLGVAEDGGINSTTMLSPDNQARIAYLFENNLYDLPDSQRPDCHRLKPHRYKAMYGRLHWGKPAPTITSGFCSPGQGRFIHPLRRRTLTPHEAARVQFFPDFFQFATLSRKALRGLIANAVPCKLAFAVVLELMRHSPRT